LQRKPKRAKKFALVFLSAGFLVGAFGALTEFSAVSLIGAVGIIAATGWDYCFCRCPHCGRHLDRTRIDKCPYCGGLITQ